MREINVELLIGKKVVDSNGRKVGKIHEVVVDRAEEYCPVQAYYVGERALLLSIASWVVPARFGESIQATLMRPFRIEWQQMDLSDPAHPRATVSKDELKRIQSR